MEAWVRTRHVGMVVAIAVCASACFGGAGSSERQSMPIPTLIRPSASIGPVTIGESRAKVEVRLGPGKSEPLGDAASFLSARVRYPAAGLEVSYSKSATRPIVLQVATQSSRYHTRSGIRIGSVIDRLGGLVPVTCRGRFAVRSCDVGKAPHSGPAMNFHARSGRIDRISLIAVFAADGHLSPPDPTLAATG
jgi:hypothetical protein